MLWIGIDPGKHTGFAVWNSKTREFVSIETLPIHTAMERVLEYAAESLVTVVFEDARQRKFFGKNENKVQAKVQGAGSIKREFGIWEDFLNDKGITFWARKPEKGMTKKSAEQFRRWTKWEKRTSEHARDAAMLVFGK